MIGFQVNDMTCGHCVDSITRAVKSIDKDASVNIDLAAHSVTIDPTVADEAALARAIAAAGYTPVPLPGVAARVTAPAASKGGGCCCG